MSQSESETSRSSWTFSFIGLLWLVIGGAAFFTMQPVLIAVGLSAVAYAIYLFRGGTYKFIIW